MTSSHDVLIVTAMEIEARAMRRGAPGATVVRSGIGPRRARDAARKIMASPVRARAGAVAGFAGAVTQGLAPGDVVVADRIDGGGASVHLPGAELLAGALRSAGLRVHVGPIVSSERLVRGEGRAALGRDGVLAVDMESAWLLDSLPSGARAVIRVVVDTPEHELASAASLANGVRAYRVLVRCAPVIERWAEAVRHRRVVLAQPRSFCAGVDRAIDTVTGAIDRFGAPVYVRKQIVHNTHVVADLERRGAVFVDELDEVPDGSTVVFSAHGVTPAVRDDAARRPLRVIDATCPLVAKVHTEVRRFARAGNTVMLIGHPGHDETVGTMGEVPGIKLVDLKADVDAIEVDDPDRVAYVTQTTLAMDEVSDVVTRLHERFPSIVGPAADDVCYATQNRQDAVRRLAEACDIVLVVGSTNSSNSNRLVEVAKRQGCRSWLIEDATELRVEMLDADRIGVTAGASAPESIVQEVVACIGGLGPVDVEQLTGHVEEVRFALPVEVR
jgi:4-hydroxy-3-methylbut-2-enyl diphosphate reductase